MAEFIQVGSGNLVSRKRLISVVSADSAPVRRLVQEARDRSVLIDATSGKKSKSVLVMDSDHIVLSAMSVEEIQTGLTAVEDET